MSGGPHRNPDKTNTIGIVVVGICGAVLVYVTIVALQAFYLNDTSEIQTMADYGGNDATAKSIRTSQVGAINEYGKNAGDKPTFRMPIDLAMKKVVDAAKVDPSLLVPTQGRADKATVQPKYGRPLPLATPAPADGAGAGSAAAPADGAGSAAAPADGAGAGSATPAAGSATPATDAKGNAPQK